MPDDAPIVETLASFADTLVSGFDIADLFHRLVDSCIDLTDADDAGLLLMDRAGDLRIAAATSQSAHLVELLQLQGREGPCLDAFRTGDVVTSGRLDDEEAQRRWPEFSEMATTHGFGSVVAVPMRLRETVLGSLNLFSNGPGAASDRDVLAAQALADLATIAIVNDRAVVGAREVIDQLQTALDTRVSIEQAKGIVAEAFELDVTAAFERIRKYARMRNLQLREVTAGIISGEVPLDVLNQVDG